MKLIIHDADRKDVSAILAARTAKHLMGDKRKAGDMVVIEFENGEAYAAKRTKTGVSVWKQS